MLPSRARASMLIRAGVDSTTFFGLAPWSYRVPSRRAWPIHELAKRPETRTRRIEKFGEMLSRGETPYPRR